MANPHKQYKKPVPNQEDNASVSIVKLPWHANGSDGREESGVISIDVDHNRIRATGPGGTNALISQCIAKSKYAMGLADGRELTIQEAADLSVSVATMLYVGASKGYAALYQFAIWVYTSGAYVGATERFGTNYGNDKQYQSMTLAEKAWMDWCDNIFPETGEGAVPEQVKSDLRWNIKGICDHLGMDREVIVRVIKTDQREVEGEDGRKLMIHSARVEIGSIVFNIPNVMDSQLPVRDKFTRPVLQMEVGEVKEFNESVGPMTFAERPSLIRDLGPYVRNATTEDLMNRAVALAAVATSNGIRKSSKSNNGETPEDDKSTAISTIDQNGNPIIILKPKNAQHKVWALDEIKPRFRVVEEIGHEN